MDELKQELKKLGISDDLVDKVTTAVSNFIQKNLGSDAMNKLSGAATNAAHQAQAKATEIAGQAEKTLGDVEKQAKDLEDKAAGALGGLFGKQ